MQATQEFKVGDRVMIEYGGVREGTVAEYREWGAGNREVDVLVDDEKFRAMYGNRGPDGGVVHPIECRNVLLRLYAERADHAAELHDKNVRCRTLLEALTAVGKGFGDDVCASLARIEAALAVRS